MRSFKKGTKWDILSEHYRAYISDYLKVKKHFKSCSIKVGSYPIYTNEISIAINKKGIFLRSFLIYRKWCPALLIPFDEIEKVEMHAGKNIPSKIIYRILGGPFLKLTLKKVPDINIFVAKYIFDFFKIPKEFIKKSNGILSLKQ